MVRKMPQKKWANNSQKTMACNMKKTINPATGKNWTEEEIMKHFLIEPPKTTPRVNNKDKTAIKSTIIPASKPNDLSIESEGMPADFIQKVKMIRYAQAQGVEIRLNELCTWEKQHQQDSEQQLAQQAATSQISDLLTIIKPKNSLPKSNISASTTTSTPSNSTTTSAPNNS